MLRSVRELERFRVVTTEGRVCGRVKDIYFDDLTWGAAHVVVSLEPRQFGQKRVLVNPALAGSFSEEEGLLQVKLGIEELEGLPLASSVRPVCKQYAALAYASPGARMFTSGMAGADAHLRSARGVMDYRVNAAGELGGTLADFLIDDEGWAMRYLGIEQMIERKKLRFYVLPQSVKRFSWATRQVILSALQPVALADRDAASDSAEAA